MSLALPPAGTRLRGALGTDVRPDQEEKAMSPEKIDAVASELKKFAQNLNLSDAQKEKLNTFLTEHHARLQQIKQQIPNISKSDLAQKIVNIRASLRQQVVKFLTPVQLERWDAEVAKAKEFLGHSVSA
jgi:protein CpxP